MKIYLVLFILFFSCSVFSKTIVIDCDTSVSYKISNKKIWYKMDSTDFQWVIASNIYLVTDNETEIVLGSNTYPWMEKKYNRLRIKLSNPIYGIVQSFYYYDKEDTSKNYKLNNHGCGFSID